METLSTCPQCRSHDAMAAPLTRFFVISQAAQLGRTVVFPKDVKGNPRWETCRIAPRVGRTTCVSYPDAMMA